MGAAVAGSKGVISRETAGCNWQARRTSAGAEMRLRTVISAGFGALKCSMPSPTLTRQVVHRPRPPQTDAWRIPDARKASKTDQSGGMSMTWLSRKCL